MSEIVRFETLTGAGGKGPGPRDQVAVFTDARGWIVHAAPQLFYIVDGRRREVDSITDTDRGSIWISLAGGVEAIRNRLKYAAEHADEYPKTNDRVFAVQHVIRFRLSDPGFCYCCPFCSREYVRSGDFGRHVERVHAVFAIEWEGVYGAALTGWGDRLIEPAEVPMPQFDIDPDDNSDRGDDWKKAA